LQRVFRLILLSRRLLRTGQAWRDLRHCCRAGVADSKYSLALEIAASQKINSIVVEDDRVASDCIKVLKRNKFGIASFLPLNKIRPVPVKKEVKDLAKSKGVFGLAVDLIDFDPKFRDVFSYVFGNTLIIDSIDTARQIGIGAARMVSLDGVCRGFWRNDRRLQAQDRGEF